jgi:molecular chaperone Hsp33
VATGLVAEAAVRHGTAPTSSAALGRTLMGAQLLAAGASDGERVQVHFRGDGPIRTLLAIANSSAEVRGLVGNPDAHLPSRRGKLDVGGAVGSGTLSVVRSHPSWREPYTGLVPIVSGEIAEDLGAYLMESEQSPAVVALGVHVDSDGSVDAAGGFLIRAMPEAPEESLSMLEANVRGLPSPSEMVRSGLDPDDMLDRLLHGLGSSKRHRTRPVLRCPCDRERMLRAVIALGRSEMRDVVDSGEDVEVVCEFCRDRHVFAVEEVESLLQTS